MHSSRKGAWLKEGVTMEMIGRVFIAIYLFSFFVNPFTFQFSRFTRFPNLSSDAKLHQEKVNLDYLIHKRIGFLPHVKGFFLTMLYGDNNDAGNIQPIANGKSASSKFDN